MKLKEMKIEKAVKAIQEKFKNIKLPHMKISGSFSLNPPKVPHLEFYWYLPGGFIEEMERIEPISRKETVQGLQEDFYITDEFSRSIIEAGNESQKAEEDEIHNNEDVAEEKKREIGDLMLYEDKKFYIASKMGIEPDKVEEMIRKAEEEMNLTPDQAVAKLKATLDMTEALKEVVQKLSNTMEVFAARLQATFARYGGASDVEIRKRELWAKYYQEKSKMSNNERRRRGIPMVRRPKAYQYRKSGRMKKKE